MSLDPTGRKGRILERLTINKIDTDDVLLAAYLGDEDAKWVPVIGQHLTAPDDLKSWFAQMPFVSKNKRAATRIVLSLARTAREEYEATLPDRLQILRHAMRKLLVPTERIVLADRPSEEEVRHLFDLVLTMNEEPMLLADQDGLVNQASRLSLALIAAQAFIEDSRRAINEAALTARILWHDGEGMIRDVIREQVCPWLLGEGDLLRDAPTPQ